MFEAEKGGCGGRLRGAEFDCGSVGLGEAAVGRGGREAVDFYSHECAWCPGC